MGSKLQEAYCRPVKAGYMATARELWKVECALARGHRMAENDLALLPIYRAESADRGRWAMERRRRLLLP